MALTGQPLAATLLLFHTNHKPNPPLKLSRRRVYCPPAFYLLKLQQMMNKSKFMMGAMMALAYTVQDAGSTPFFGEQFKTHGGHSTPSKSGRNPKQIKANRKKNKNARNARKNNSK